MGLVALTTAQTYLGVTGATEILNTIINGVSKRIQSYCKRTFSSVTYNEKFDVVTDHQDRIVVSHPNLTSVIAMTDNSVQSPSLVATSCYTVYSHGEVVLNTEGHWFTKGVGSVTITYTAGLTTVPADIELAALELIDATYNRRGKGAFEREKIGDYSYTIPNIREECFESVRKTLDLYVADVV